MRSYSSYPPLSRSFLRERLLGHGSRSSYSREACPNGEGWRPLRTPVLSRHLPPHDSALANRGVAPSCGRASNSFVEACGVLTPAAQRRQPSPSRHSPRADERARTAPLRPLPQLKAGEGI
jgi:hypothetical protein